MMLSFFDDRHIADCLAGMRAKQCVKRHDARALDRYFVTEKSAPSGTSELESRVNDPGWYMPPRSLWSRVRLDRRIRTDKTRHNKLAILQHVNWVLANGKLGESDWGRRFLDFAGRVRARVSSGSLTFSQPISFAIAKSGKDVRFVTSFENLEDKVILSLAAKYLRSKLDSSLSDACYSFRQDGSIDHLSAVGALVDFRKRHAGEELWAAECDIRKFFDTIDHDVALASFDRLAKGKDIDPVARGVLVAYLKAYTSLETLVKGARPKSREKCCAYVEKIREALGALGERPDARVGIPQGGALSGLIANWVLATADRAVERKLKGGFYARYCDDIVIVCDNKRDCRLARDRYLRAMKRLRLPVHPMKNSLAYGPRYYEAKSKGPYRWMSMFSGTPLLRGTAPWVSFLGNQVNAVGEVRVRASSIKRHQVALKAERNRALWLIDNCVLRKGVSERDVARVLATRIVSKGVGYLRVGPFAAGKGEMSWMSAFEKIHGRAAEHQLRDLDAWRQRLLHPLIKGAGFYFGRPASYHGYYEEVARPGHGKRLRPIARLGYSAL